MNKEIWKVFIGIIFIIFGALFLFKNQYWQSLISIALLLILPKLDKLTEFILSPKDGINAKFDAEKEKKAKIEEDIRENNEYITPESFNRFKKIEEVILNSLQKKYGGELKTLVHFMYGKPDKPEFRYTPDGVLQTSDSLYFLEIKYVIKPEFAKVIVKNNLKYLSEVYSKLLPSIGDKRFVIKLILASAYDLSDMSFDIPKGIEIEFYKVDF